MSRSAVKSRGERQGGRGSRSPQSAAPPSHAATGPRGPCEAHVDVVDPVMVRGPLTEAQWTLMLGQEEAEDTVGQIMEALLADVMERCSQSYTERQLRPFSVSWTRDCVLRLVEWQFLHGAEGGGEPPKTHHEDPESPPGTTDSWAQGCVPVVRGTKPPLPDPPTTAQKQVPFVTPLTPTPPPSAPKRDRRRTTRRLSTHRTATAAASFVASPTTTMTKARWEEKEERNGLPSIPPPSWSSCQENTDYRAGPGSLDHRDSPHYKILDTAGGGKSTQVLYLSKNANAAI